MCFNNQWNECFIFSDSVKREKEIDTHGSLSTDCTMEFKNVSVAAVRLFMAASILAFTSGCLMACSGSTSYGNLLKKTKCVQKC